MGNVPGEQKITHRVGDVYFGESLIGFPPIPEIYRRFIPENYEDLITDKERTINFISIGSPFRWQFKSNSHLGIITNFVIENRGEEFVLADLKDKFEFSNLSSHLCTLVFRFERESVFYELTKSESKPIVYSLVETTPREYDLERIAKLDIELGLVEDKDTGLKESYDSSML